MSSEYSAVFQKALSELRGLLEERRELSERLAAVNQRITTVRQGAMGLAGLVGIPQKEIKVEFPELLTDLIEPDLGLTDAVRRVLSASDKWATPTEIRDELIAIGFDLSKYTNALASLHTTLKRLVETEEAVSKTRSDGKTIYWSKEAAEESERVFRELDEAKTKMLDALNKMKKKK